MTRRRVVRVLDLCSGTQSVGRAARLVFGAANVEYTSVDLDPRSDPTHVADMRKFDYRKHFRPGDFDLVWASPPCTQYSIARRRVTTPPDFKTADAIVKACFEVIRYLKPEKWYLENPATGLLKGRAFMRPYAPFMKVASYCKYGFPYRKQTSIWTNVEVTPRNCNTNPCPHKRRTGKHAQLAQRGPNGGASDGTYTWATSSNELYRVPMGLLRQLFEAPRAAGR